MLTNVGKWDRLIRILAGIAILVFLPQTTWALLGLLPLATGISGYCPLYRIFGWSTDRKTKAA
jgi:hypothetical protein